MSIADISTFQSLWITPKYFYLLTAHLLTIKIQVKSGYIVIIGNEQYDGTEKFTINSNLIH